MLPKSAAISLGILILSALLYFNQKDSTVAYLSSKKAAPKMTLWRVDSMHLLDGTKGKADLWPCDSQYYFNYHKNQSEDIIIEIKNEGDADLVLTLPLTLSSGSFGPVTILEQPHLSVVGPGEETHFIVRHTGGAEYIHSEATVVINSNDSDQAVCNINFEVGEPLVCGFGLIDFINKSICNNNSTTADANDDFYTTDIDISFVNKPGSGNLELTGPGLLSPFTVAASTLGASRDTLFGVQIKADGLSQQITFHFTNNGCGGNCMCNDDFASPTAVKPCSYTNYYVDACLLYTSRCV